MTDIEVVRPGADGQAMRGIATALTRAWAIRGAFRTAVWLSSA
jgi:hypothetical protein